MTAAMPSAGAGTRALPLPVGPVAPTAGAACRLRPVPVGAVSIERGLLAQRREVNGEVAIPSGRQQLEAAGNLDNLRIAAGAIGGPVRGPVFMDSDVYKWLEAAAWEYARRPSPQLLRAQQEVTAVVAAAQQDDGYLDSVVQVRDGQRYADLATSHEHYCAGHLFQAAVAQVRCTGGTALLEVAVRLADHLVRTFGPHGRHDLDGHPEVEMSLVELFRQTGTRDYLELARYFVDARGHATIGGGYRRESTYFSDRVPVREQATVEGHAVRAVYLGAGAADVALELGDTRLLAALERQHAAMQATKTYLTGGLGSRWDGESFGDPYELPPDRAYAESCAAIGGMSWAWRMLLATGDPGYADVIERELYNGMLAGVSLSGSEFFYVNPLQLRTGAYPDEPRSPAHGRRPWFDVACCPPNIMRTLASLPGYLATTDGEGVQLQLYADARLTVEVPGGQARLAVVTDYPWDGVVRVRCEQAPGSVWTLSLRIPAWAQGAGVTVDGKRQQVRGGSFARLSRTWRAGDVVELELPLAVRVVEADERVDAVRGCVALERGPLVFAVEQVDQAEGVSVDGLRLDPAAEVVVEHRPQLLGGVTVLKARGRAVRRGRQTPWPYRPAGAEDGIGRDGARHESGDVEPTDEEPIDVELTAVPYFSWANRGASAMRVWLPRA